MAGQERPEVGHPPAQAEGAVYARGDVQGQWATIQGQVRGRACVRAAEGRRQGGRNTTKSSMKSKAKVADTYQDAQPISNAGVIRDLQLFQCTEPIFSEV